MNFIEFKIIYNIQIKFNTTIKFYIPNSKNLIKLLEEN